MQKKKNNKFDIRYYGGRSANYFYSNKLLATAASINVVSNTNKFRKEEKPMNMNIAMKTPESEPKVTSTYRERQYGKTIYCITSVYKGQKDLRQTLENLAISKVSDELINGISGKVNA